MPKAKKTGAKPKSKDRLVEVLAEHSIALQKALTDSIITMNKLMQQQQELLNTFQEAAKHINDIDVKDENLRPLMKKLDDFLNQNRTIARGLLLLEKYVKERQGPMPPPKF